MIHRVSLLLQIVIAVAVAALIVLASVFAFGPDIDGRTPSMWDTVQVIAIGSAIILAFTLAAIALHRWPKFGWSLSVLLDGLLGLVAISMMVGDFNDRYLATQEGRNAFHGDLATHGAVLLLCVGATGLLLLARRQFLTNKAKRDAPA